MAAQAEHRSRGADPRRRTDRTCSRRPSSARASVHDLVREAQLRASGVTVLDTSDVDFSSAKAVARLRQRIVDEVSRSPRRPAITLSAPAEVEQLPPHVRHSLRRLLAADSLCRDPDGPDSGGRDACDSGPSSPATTRLGAVDAEEALTLLEAGEAVKAWVESVQADATERLHAALSEQLLDEPDLADLSRTARDRALAGVRDTTCAEIEAATGKGQTAVRKELGFATASPTRTRRARELMRQGLCSAYRAQVVEQETGDLDPDIADEIAGVVLCPRPDGAPWSHRQFRRRLANRRRAHCPPEEDERERRRALERRDAGAELQRDGTGEAWITGEGSRVAAAMERVDTLARRFRCAGDSRTLAQLRSDVALDLLLYGWVPPTGAAPAGHPATAGPVAPDSAQDPMASYRALGAPPVAHVDLVVSLTTLLGVEHGVGQIPGQGPVPAAMARRIALQLGSTWSRLVTDPLSGRCLERSASGYRFDADMARQIRARDGTCRGPGCTVPASRCDLDHEEEWRVDGAGRPVGGATSEANGYAKHRRHHNLKTRRHWRSEPGPDGTLVWTTATGRRYVSWPMDYRDETQTDPCRPPPDDEESLDDESPERGSPDHEPPPF